MTNPWNEDKPLKMCRDGQELPMDIGEMLIKMFHERDEQPLGRHMQAGVVTKRCGRWLSRALDIGMDLRDRLCHLGKQS